MMLRRVRMLLRQSAEDSEFLESPPVQVEISETVDDQSEMDITQVGPYKIREKIGEGGMGVVYVAEQTEPVQRKVAIKVIKPGMDTKEVIARFEAERQALAFMEHPNIARVLDAGATKNGRSYFVMELVRGIPITDYCDEVKATPRDRLELFQTVCDAVQHAHQKGIIHRDIKPSNVLVTQLGAMPVVKVIDFGLAKATSGQKLTDKTVYTAFMKLMGTPVYMSPEQAGLSGLDIDTRSDVYSLGVLLYELLTGTTPLDKAEIQQQAYDELCRQIREVEAPKPSTRVGTLMDDKRSTIAQKRQVEPKNLRRLLNGDLDVVVLKALEKDRDRRYETPKDLATDVERFLNDEPVTAVPPSQLYLARKYFRRHRAAIVTVASVLGLLILATGFSSRNESGKLVGYPFDGDASTSTLSANGRWALVPDGRALQLIDVSSGKVAHEMPGERFSISSNSIFLACWGSEGEVSIWNIEASPPKPVAPLRSTEFTTLPNQGDLLLAPDGKSFLLRRVPESEGYLRNDVLAFVEGRSRPIPTTSPAPVGAWAWSPHGKLIAVGVLLGQIRLQHVAQPEKRFILASYGKQITSLAFSPDSKTLASGGQDGTIELWDVSAIDLLLERSDEVQSLDMSNEEIDALPVRVIKAHVGAVRSLAFSANGLNFASSDEFGVTKRWDVVETDEIQVQDATENLYGGTLGIVPRLTDDEAIIEAIWPDYPGAESGELERGDRIIRIANGASSPMRNATDVPQLELFAFFQSGRPASTVRMEVERDDGKRKIVELVRGAPPSPDVGRVAFAPDSKSMATASIFLGATVFDSANNQTQRQPRFGSSVAYSPDGRFLAMDDHFHVAIWDVERNQLHCLLECKRELKYARDAGGSLAFSPDGKYLALGAGWPFLHAPSKSRLIVWDVTELEQIENVPAQIGFQEPIYENDHILAAVSFTPNGMLIAVDHVGVVRIWETASWKLLDTLQFPKTTAMDISPDGNILALGFGVSQSADAGVILWDINAKKHLRTLVGHRPFAIAFSPDGKTLVSTSERHDVVLWDVVTGLPLRTMEGHGNVVAGAAFSSDGTKLAPLISRGNCESARLPR